MTPHCPEGWTPPTAETVCALLHGRTQTATAAALGITGRQVRRWMKGEARMGWATWYTLTAWVAANQASAEQGCPSEPRLD